MYKSKQRDLCPNCGSDDWNTVNAKGRNGERSTYNGDVVLCVNCNTDTPLDEMVDGGYRYYIYAGHSFNTPEEAIADLQVRLAKEL